MKIFSSILLLLLLSLLNVNAQTQRWIYHGATDDAKHYYDANIRRAPTGILTTWEKWLYNDDSFAFVLTEFNCQQGKIRFVSGTKYSAAGKIINSSEKAGNWQIPTPESIAESAFQVVCKVSNAKSSLALPNFSENSTNDKAGIEIPNPLYVPKEDQSYIAKENRIIDSDAGVDIARVIVQKANLRASAYANSSVITELSKGNVLVLLSKEPSGVWYNVINVETSEEGWIHGNNIEVQFTNERQISKPTLARTTTERSDVNPYVIIKNDSEKTLYLKLGASRYVIEPNYTKRVDLTPGSYKFYASSPKVLPDIGEITFERGAYYTWRFYTHKVYRP